MCGIAGVTGPFQRTEAEALGRAMNETLVHRGPDDHGLWAADGIAIAMRRLSIIDLAGGHQPMWSGAAEGQGLGIVFNGAIYNYRALKAELEACGERFRTKSDTEVLLRVMAQEGLDGVQRLEGMFAFALYDAEARTLHLVRDRMGIKPLYYAALGDRFYFASELKAILAALPARPALNRAALHHYLTLRYVPGPETIWRGVYKLPPGHRLSYRLAERTLSLSRYWRFDFRSEEPEPERDYPAEFESLLLGAVEKRLLAADVPVGLLLSGGIDSSAVGAAAVELGHRRFHTFSVAFRDAPSFSELDYARDVARHIDSIHHEVEVDRQGFLDFLPRFVRYADEPLADLTAIPLYYLAALARTEVKVVLSGEGADEMLAGYGLERLAHGLARLERIERIVPKPALKLIGSLWPGARGEALRRLGRSGWSDFLRDQGSYISNCWSEAEKASLWRRGADAEDGDTRRLIASWYDESTSRHPLDRLQQAYSVSWLVEDLLAKADRMSMAASLELRVPFLDHRLVEWAARLPLQWKVGDAAAGYRSKRILRGFAERRLPRRILERPKRGFPIPVYDWLKDELSAYAEERVLAAGNPLEPYFEQAPIRAALDRARAGEAPAAHKVWVLIVLAEWLSAWR